MTKLTAELSAEEVRKASSEAIQQDIPQTNHFYTFVGMMLVLCLYIGEWISFPIAEQLPVRWGHWAAPLLEKLIPVALFLVGLVVLNDWQYGRALSAYNRTWKARNVPEWVEAKYEINGRSLSMKTERGEFVAYWHSVVKIAKVASGWLVLSDLNSYLIPSAAFSDENAEKQFLRLIFERLEEAAQMRSGEAKSFSEGDAMTGAG